ncbi:MAG: UDP-N-acetylmuramoyl-L-alanyl-D-glutamate--2,6-diaminopimelate ligase [Patescibacteria group bacterium]|jgi:UDP-N-acetylmuramoyl-L-alanyl-D-glutamate--2,6-diaminopimelate ligase
MKTIKRFFKKFISRDFLIWTHKLRGAVAAAMYNFPAKSMIVIGVTGTAGKTTTCNLIADILSKSGKSVAMATTVNFRIGDKIWPNNTKMTTVSPMALQSFIAKAVSQKCEYLVLETSSHAIDQYRNWGISYHTVLFTNLSHEHLDYHHSMQEYKEVKGRLFANNPETIIVNADDKVSDYFLDFKAKHKITYGLNKADVSAKKILSDAKSSLFTLVASDSQIAIELPLTGKFNIYNAIAAASVGLSFNISLNDIKSALEATGGVSGRMERVDMGQNFEVIVDFAHTPDELQNVYETLKSVCRSEMIAVLGSMGERDRTKRPVMGALAGRFANTVIITNEDPVNEDPIQIIEEVAKGVPRGASKDHPMVENKNFFKIVDRREAIAKAFSLAKARDIVILTGKGGEHVMAIGDEKIPWDEVEIVREELKKLLGKTR